MEQLYAHARLAHSHDGFLCHLQPEVVETVVPSLPHDERFECLDIASAGTLGGLADNITFLQASGQFRFPSLSVEQASSVPPEPSTTLPRPLPRPIPALTHPATHPAGHEHLSFRLRPSLRHKHLW